MDTGRAASAARFRSGGHSPRIGACPILAPAADFRRTPFFHSIISGKVFMATRIMMKHPHTGIIKAGFFGFSWTTFFFGGFPALFRGQVLLGLIVIVINFVTLGIAGIIWAFFYNKSYTLGLLKKGYEFADSEGLVSLARAKLGVAAPAAALPGKA
jgi:hypothetical protein